MHNSKQTSKVVALILLTSVILLTVLNPNIASVKAQGQATVNVLDSVGGTTDPAGPGTYTYTAGTAVTLTPTPANGFVFLYWLISTDAGSNIDYNDPATLPVSGGTTYTVQAVFQPENVPTQSYKPTANQSADAVVVVLPSAGGTTNPGPGIYALANATQLTLTAVPASGWQFSHWVISGGPMTGHGGFPFTATPTDNPYNVDHGYGYSYDYQPVFTPIGSTEPTPTPTGPIGGLSMETTIIIALVVVLVIVLIAFGAYAYMKRK